MTSTAGCLRRLSITLVLSLATGLPAAAADGDGVARQRSLFVSVYGSAARGNWAPVRKLPAEDRQALEDYLLWPDLEAAWLTATLETVEPAQVESFLGRYGALRPARDLRYRYALHLAGRGEHEAYLDVYRSFYQGQDIAALDCAALAAEIELGRSEKKVVGRARGLWLVGYSQVEACDPVFAWLGKRNLLTEVDYRARFALAVEARQFRLARWLSRSLDAETEAEAGKWLEAAADPRAFVRDHVGDERWQAQLAYAVERITYRDPAAAYALWQKLTARQTFPPALLHATARHIALWTARNRLPDAQARLADLAPEAADDEVGRWRARSSLRAGDFDRLASDIGQMSPAEQTAEEWRYWRAIALLGVTGNADQARGQLESLATRRSYYGFLAADELGRDYSFGHDALPANETALEALAARPDIARARELFLVGHDRNGRAEWNAAVRVLSDEERSQAAILAHRWGWHSRAISTAASLGEYDDLALRYPLPFREAFEQHASAARIPTTWALGVARSESLFMHDVRSSAGAIGLMQLMPETGRQVAREIDLEYSGLSTLTDPGKNIRLGTSYLGMMAERYSGNRVLATAAYNAGPHRVDRWLPAQDDMDARIWIENIPYNETRGYVRRVLEADIIFHWRMTGEILRLREVLPVISPAVATIARSSEDAEDRSKPQRPES